MASVDLVFQGAPLTTGTLVFGDDGGSNVSDAVLSGAITLVRPSLAGTLVLGTKLSGAVTLARPTLSGTLVYKSDTQRPLVARVTARWQDADTQPEHTQARWQDTTPQPEHTGARWQDAVRVFESSEIEWGDADRTKRSAVGVRFQDGRGEHTGARQRFQDGRRTPNTSRQRFQDGVGVHQGATTRFQDGIRGIAGQHRQRYQDAILAHYGFEAGFGSGRLVETGWKTRYQDGVQPRPGITDFTPVIPPVEPCYTPSGDLVFEMPWSTDTNLVFFCEKHDPGPDPEPGETIVVPIRKVYVVLNTATLRRVAGNVPLPTFSMSMSLDVDSWTWSFSAALPGRAKADLEPAGDGTPVTVEATVNGVPYRFLIEKIGRDRGFAEDALRISGRGLAAELDAPIAPVQSFGNTIDRTAQQLMGDVLSVNGVPLPGWSVDWQLEDWLVAANAWKKQGSYIEALNEIAAAAGGYVQPTPATKVVKVLPRYPALPWAWDDVTPDYELPAAAFTREGIDWVEKARYDRVYVSGQGTGGRLVNVRRAGTAGENVAPMVTDALITDTIAGRQRGGAILADTGRIANFSLRGAAGVKDVDGVPVGIIPPGKFIRYIDNGVERLGITRSVSVEVSMPDIWQTIGVETHESL